MKKSNFIKWTLMTIAAVLVSNLIQFYVSGRNHVGKNEDTFQSVYESKYDIYSHYSNRIQMMNMFLLQLEYSTHTPNEGYLYSDGFFTGISTDYYTYLETLIRKMDSSEYNDELNNIIETNHNLHLMVNELKSYFDAHRDDSKLPENWGKVKVLIKKISALLSEGSSNDMNFYNITSHPEDFIMKSDYATTMSSLNEKIAEVIDIIRN